MARRRLLAAALMTGGALAAGLAMAQPPAATPKGPQPKAAEGLNFGRAGGETERYRNAGAAATRGLNICSGKWSGGLTDQIIDTYLNRRDPSGALPDLRTEVDERARTVQVHYAADMPPRIVIWRPVLGCVQLPVGATMEAVRQLPQVAASVRPPNYDHLAWPMGDQNATAELPGPQKAALDRLVDAAFDGRTYQGTTWGLIVVKDGKIVAERYALGFDMHKGSQTHSAAKSFASTVIGIGSRYVDLERPGALKEWRRPGDPRGRITLQHLLRMSSGLYGEGNGSPQNKIYSQGGTVADLAATNILHTLPGERFVYNPPDTMLAMRALRQGMNNDRKFWAFPYQELFWKIGMTRTTTNSDWNGDFLMSGQSWSTARDFARFGLLYMNDGLWQGKRILPEGWAKYVVTRGPAQPASGAGYGAQFWLYGGQNGLPADAFSPNGGQGHFAMIIPSKGVVVVRRGFDAGGTFQITRFSADVLKALDL
jgi:hypothetical protein